MRDQDIKVPSAHEVISALERILASSGLSPNSRRTTLLRHIVNQAVAGRPERLTGTAIAFDVFGRGADFDPLNDSIVRTEARRVRHVLNSYYAGPGLNDPIRISIPKGTYVPKFERGPAGALAADNQGAGERSPAAPATSASPGLEGGSSIQPRITRSIGFAVVVVASILAMVTASLWWTLRPNGARANALLTPAVLVSPFKPAGEDALVGVLAEGLTVRLIADLMKVPDFRLYTFDSFILES